MPNEIVKRNVAMLALQAKIAMHKTMRALARRQTLSVRHDLIAAGPHHAHYVLQDGPLRIIPIDSPVENEALDSLASQAEAAADRACEAIDDVLAFVEASNLRILAMESRAAEVTA